MPYCIPNCIPNYDDTFSVFLGVDFINELLCIVIIDYIFLTKRNALCRFYAIFTKNYYRKLLK